MASKHGATDSLDVSLAQTESITERIRLITHSASGRIAFSTSLSLEDQVILHGIADVGAPIDVFMVETGRNFPETLVASEQRYNLRIRVLAPQAADLENLVARYSMLGFRTSIEAPKVCCSVRKVLPLKRGLNNASGRTLMVEKCNWQGMRS
jgi:phosphoadenosine phosphosulfate reductase